MWLVFVFLEGLLEQRQGVEQEAVDTQGKQNQSKEYASEARGVEIRL